MLERLYIKAKNPEQLVKSTALWHILNFQDILLSKPDHQSTEYTLTLSRSPMSHGDRVFNGYSLTLLPRKITRTAKTTPLHNASDWISLSIPASTNKPISIEAIFVPLGWLVESGIEQGHKFKRITNYVVLLNISTDPISLWLAYDYYPTVDGDLMATVQLSDSEYFNPDYHSRNPKPTQQNATNPPKKEKRPSSRAIRRGILQASGFEASIEARGDQSIGTEVGLHNLPYNVKRRILEKCEYIFLSKAETSYS